MTYRLASEQERRELTYLLSLTYALLMSAWLALVVLR